MLAETVDVKDLLVTGYYRRREHLKYDRNSLRSKHFR